MTKRFVVIAPNDRLADWAARFVLEVSPLSCYRISLDRMGAPERLLGLRCHDIDVRYFNAPRLEYTRLMLQNLEEINLILLAAEVRCRIHQLP